MTAINGMMLSEDVSPGTALVNLAGQNVTLTVLPKGTEESRTVTVKTLNSEVPVMYRQWVNANRERVQSGVVKWPP